MRSISGVRCHYRNTRFTTSCSVISTPVMWPETEGIVVGPVHARAFARLRFALRLRLRLRFAVLCD